MESFFKKAADDVDKLEQEFLGPDYQYYKGIKTPNDLKMSSDGNMETMSMNVAGIMDYVEILVSGRGAASKTGQPLGNKFFLPTGGKCTIKTNKGEKKKVQRSLYINNVPDGDIPFISAGMGQNFTEFEGLLPGILEDVGNLNPLPLFSSFMQGSAPPCTKITMPTIDESNNPGTGSGYVLNSEIQSMNSAWFTSANPKPSESTLEGFINANNCMNNIVSNKRRKLKPSLISNLLRTSVGFMMIYFIYKISHK
jgi:hypothetical protein